jgi:hypothetical protein
LVRPVTYWRSIIASYPILLTLKRTSQADKKWQILPHYVFVASLHWTPRHALKRKKHTHGHHRSTSCYFPKRRHIAFSDLAVRPAKDAFVRAWPMQRMRTVCVYLAGGIEFFTWIYTWSTYGDPYMAMIACMDATKRWYKARIYYNYLNKITWVNSLCMQPIYVSSVTIVTSLLNNTKL